MGRPKKQTVDWFPHYTNASDGRTLTIIQNQFGNNGYAAWFRLLERLGQTEGHYYCCSNPSDWEYLIAKLYISPVMAEELLETLARLGAIDAELWSHKVIWCQNFVNGVSEVYRRREILLPQRPLQLVSAVRNPTADVVSTTNNPTADGSKSPLHKRIPADKPVSAATNAITDVGNTTHDVITTDENTQRERVERVERVEREKVIAIVTKRYEDNIGLITPIIADSLRDAVDVYPSDWIGDAIDAAVKNNVHRWSYIARILENWQRDGRSNGHKPNNDKPVLGVREEE